MQKALFLDQKFNGKFYVATTEIYKPGPGQLLVKVIATAMNPVYWKIQKYGIFAENYPAILGTDIAGQVEEIGEGVTGFSKGDRVFCQGTFANDRAGFQQFTLTNYKSTAKIPSSLSYEEASTIPVALTVCYVGLYNKAPYGIGLTPPVDESGVGKYSNQPILILGGSSSVGQFAIQLAKLSGFSPIITTSSIKHETLLKSVGATHVIDRNLSSEAITEQIKKITTEPIKHALDAISLADTQRFAYGVLAQGGALVTVWAKDQSVELEAGKSLTHAVGILGLPENQLLLEGMYSNLEKWVERGVIKPNKVTTLQDGLKGIVEGLKLMEDNKVSGEKLVALPQETP